ncbi:DCC1-like thiol-disulfide oxidoreductase family protein [Chryseobacterium culicis]|uniref:DUF393 domain-containing protein n=1 Tax=Chryseobacterium culicis TaxID=680127 RepID=A0A2S9CWH2_CHRCI|nr:DCC1-like thiol-disulfide oxidoreductase family protein [Chryseobacterium culicis]PRB84796.1 hypothetical protein CQ022_00470 [Chryseobacterium culicis]PRB87805.1 hypothetical protein CQ033_20405 [Chryseobacterium culicis]
MKVIIYDSECKFCTRFSKWSQSNIETLEIISVRSKEARKILRDKGIKFIDLQTIYYVNNNEVWVRSKAIFEILANFTSPWRFISFFSFLPTFFTDFCYKIFAKYRYYF